MINPTHVFSFLLCSGMACPLFAQASEPQATPSIEQLLQKADELATESDQSEAAIQKYRDVLKQHQENERRFNEALRKLTRKLEENNQQAESIQLLFELYSDQGLKDRFEFIKQALETYQRKQPDLMGRLQKEFRTKSQAQATVPLVIPPTSLLDSILQREDKGLREESLAKLKEMLAEDSSVKVKLSGLSTLVKALPAKFDHKSFYPLVAPLLAAEDQSLRYMALSCLPYVGGTEKDLQSILSMADDESIHVRKQVGASLIRIGQGKYGELVIPALVKLMQDKEEDVVRETIRSSWGEYHSPSYDQFLVELSYRKQHEHIVIYHCLSTMQSKSITVCKRLVEVLSHPDWNDSGRAAWGLTYGVTPAAREIVENGLLAAIPEETNQYTRKQEFNALKQVVTEKSRNLLKGTVNSDLESDEFKKLAQEVLQVLDQSVSK